MKNQAQKITVKVKTSAAASTITGYKDNILHVRLKAAPEKGKANKELIKLLSKTLKIPQAHITITRGHTSSLKTVQIEPPPFLYKILSQDDWKQSQTHLHLPPMDHEFIHLAKQDQLEKILKKFWKNTPNYLILKLDTNKLHGDLRLETNPGGKTHFYHLYNGTIPLNALIETTPH